MLTSVKKFMGTRAARPVVGVGAFLTVAMLALPAYASGPTTVATWSSTVVSFFTSNMPAIGLALIALAGATIVLAIGRNLLTRVWHALASLGGSSGLGRGRRR